MMAETSPTSPGPWAVVVYETPKTEQVIVQSVTVNVARLNIAGRDNTCLIGDARLIAAAPDLLAACEALIAWGDDLPDEYVGQCGICGRHGLYIEDHEDGCPYPLAILAIRKATEAQP
jgi:hypothetical protein